MKKFIHRSESSLGGEAGRGGRGGGGRAEGEGGGGGRTKRHRHTWAGTRINRKKKCVR
jgi:hypothetical protein